jgi:hypothetical protein
VMGDEDVPAANFPLGECEGDCDNDDDCEVCGLSFVSIAIKSTASNVRSSHLTSSICCSVCIFKGSLICNQRDGYENVLGCIGAGDSSTDYCYDQSSTAAPSESPSPTMLALVV